MRRVLLLLTVILMGLLCYAEPVPQLRPSAPDVPSQVKTDSVTTPGLIENNSETRQDSAKSVDDADDDFDEMDEDDEIDELPTSSKEDEKTVNPTSDSSNTQNAKSSKEKTEKVKKEKPKYGNYQGASDDPYIQSWEEESSKYTTVEDAVNAEKEAAQPKTYTQSDYEQAYRDMQVPDFSFVHGVDPDQYYDMKDTMWSPYPLLRLNAPLYFKTITIEPGYYLLTPREHDGSWYLLFKEAGKIKYIIPVFSKDFTPANYYRDNLKELDMTHSQRWQIKFLNAWGKYVRKSKRKPAITSNIELTDLDNNFVLIDLYYNAHKYSTIFRIEKF